MKKRIVWLAVSSLMVLSLVLASCAPKVTEEKKVAAEEKKEAVKEEPGMVLDALGRLVPAPQYGGAATVAVDIAAWNFPAFTHAGILSTGGSRLNHFQLTNETLITTDPLTGPLGSNEWFDGTIVVTDLPEYTKGQLAESWEIDIPNSKVTFRIKEGIRFHNKPPANGSELTAKDVVYTFVTAWGRAGTRWTSSYPYIANLKDPKQSIYIDPKDPRAVVFELSPDNFISGWQLISNRFFIMPESLGPMEGQGFGGWRGIVGTGPYLMDDLVEQSSVTWVRNPNYWKKDEFHPQNQLPYFDKIKAILIPDLSTQLAALRTGKVDWLNVLLNSEDARSLMKSNPELQYVAVRGTNYSMHFRIDTKPWDDLRVRRAMNMATDRDGMIKEYWGGDAYKFIWPIFPPEVQPEHKHLYIPLEEMPEDVRELYEYHPDRAMKLLDEAGYPGPNRFTTSVIVADEEEIDILSIIKAQWAKIGVNMIIDVKELAVKNTMALAFSYTQGITGSITSQYGQRMTQIVPGAASNYAVIGTAAKGPLGQIALEHQSMFNEAGFNKEQQAASYKKYTVPALRLAPFITIAMEKSYAFWQPWLKGYAGNLTGRQISRYVTPGEAGWIDQALKKSMGR